MFSEKSKSEWHFPTTGVVKVSESLKALKIIKLE